LQTQNQVLQPLFPKLQNANRSQEPDLYNNREARNKIEGLRPIQVATIAHDRSLSRKPR
jgi:hypothetical protein